MVRRQAARRLARTANVSFPPNMTTSPSINLPGSCMICTIFWLLEDELMRNMLGGLELPLVDCTDGFIAGLVVW